jgi:hypothetical protein
MMEISYVTSYDVTTIPVAQKITPALCEADLPVNVLYPLNPLTPNDL